MKTLVSSLLVIINSYYFISRLFIGSMLFLKFRPRLKVTARKEGVSRLTHWHHKRHACHSIKLFSAQGCHAR